MMIPFIVYTTATAFAASAALADPQKLDEVLATWRAAEASTARRAEGGDKLNGFHFRSKIGEKKRGEEKKAGRGDLFLFGHRCYYERRERRRSELLLAASLSLISRMLCFHICLSLPLSLSLARLRSLI